MTLDKGESVNTFKFMKNRPEPITLISCLGDFPRIGQYHDQAVQRNETMDFSLHYVRAWLGSRTIDFWLDGVGWL